MTTFMIYEPFYDFERIIDVAFSQAVKSDGSSRPQGREATQKNSAEGSVRSYKPRLDLHEDAENNSVTASFEFPGVNKDDIKLEFRRDNNRLVVSAESKISEEHSEQGYAIREHRYGKFSRAFQLPKGIKEDEINASMENGVLTVIFPKTTSEEAPKKIEIA